jgi:hypothetical protein
MVCAHQDGLWAAVLGVSSFAIMTASPAGAAQRNCKVDVLGVGTQNTTLMAETDGVHYQGDVLVRVTCSGVLVPGATVELKSDITAPDDEIYIPGTGWVSLAQPQQITLPTGELLVSLRTKTPNFKPGEWKVKIGSQTATVIGAPGLVVPYGGGPEATGKLWAQTPELSSLALFGTGAAGMAGYALTRLRAFRGRRD